MSDFMGGLLILGGIIFLVLHIFSLGTPYIHERWAGGRKQYEVWIRRFLGYNYLAGSFDTESEASRLVDKIVQGQE